MDIILLLLLVYNSNLGYNNFIFILSFFLFNNQGNIYRNNLHPPYYSNSNFSSNNMNKQNNMKPRNNRDIQNNMNIPNDDTPSYGVAITDYENLDYEGNNPEKTQLEHINSGSSPQKNSSNNITKKTPNTSRTRKTPFEKNTPINNTKTIPTSKAPPTSKNNSTHSKNTSTHKTNSNTQTKSWSSPVLGKNYKGTCTVVSNDGTFTGKIIGKLDNLITLQLEDDQVIYINKNSIISFY